MLHYRGAQNAIVSARTGSAAEHPLEIDDGAVSGSDPDKCARNDLPHLSLPSTLNGLAIWSNWLRPKYHLAGGKKANIRF